MTKMKYIVTEGNLFVIFSMIEDHSFMAAHFSSKVIGAGFLHFTLDKNMYGEEITQVECYGRSTTLDINSRKELDEDIINSAMRLS